MYIYILFHELIYCVLEKKRDIKKIKNDIKAFKTGINIYEKYLQLSMNISNEGLNTIITVTIRNSKRTANYNVILKETDNDFDCKCIYNFILFSPINRFCAVFCTCKILFTISILHLYTWL